MKRSILIANLAFATLVMVGCGSATSPKPSPLQERCDLLAKFAIDANLSNVVRVLVCDSTGTLLNSKYRYYYYGTPISNNDYMFTPGSLVYPLFLAALEEIDSSVLLPAVYKCFGNYEVVDHRFSRDTEGFLVDSITLQEAVAISSNVAMVTLINEKFGHRREALIHKMDSLFDGLSFPDSLDLYTDSVWYSFLQGYGFQVNMSSLIDCYSNLPSAIVEMLPRKEDGIVGLPALVVDGYRVNAMYIGISDDDLIGLVGLVLLQGSNIYGDFAREIFVSLIKNKEL